MNGFKWVFHAPSWFKADEEGDLSADAARCEVIANLLTELDITMIDGDEDGDTLFLISGTNFRFPIKRISGEL